MGIRIWVQRRNLLHCSLGLTKTGRVGVDVDQRGFRWDCGRPAAETDKPGKAAKRPLHVNLIVVFQKRWRFQVPGVPKQTITLEFPAKPIAED